MIRTYIFAAALASAFALPATATETAKTDAVKQTATDGDKQRVGSLFTEADARKHLMHLGYTNVSELSKDENGVWSGQAMKDGKSVGVAVDIKGKAIAN